MYSRPWPQTAQAACPLVEGDAVAADAPLQARRPMVAQVLADAGQTVRDRDAQAFEALALTDAGEFQQLRRGDGAGRNDDLVRGARLALSDRGRCSARPRSDCPRA